MNNHTFESPNAGELDVLGVLWTERQGENRALQLSEVFRRVCERRRQFHEGEPALSTVSTHLRKLVRKGLLEETSAQRSAQPGPMRFRGGLTPPTRSPLTSYRVHHTPGAVLQTTFQGLAAAYPPGQRLEALVDFGRALGLSGKSLRKLEQFVREEVPQAKALGAMPNEERP